jgi:hypothetical protein
MARVLRRLGSRVRQPPPSGKGRMVDVPEVARRSPAWIRLRREVDVKDQSAEQPYW